MQIVDAPRAQPAKCVECGYGGNERRYIDTNVDIEFYGVVYICELCFTHWASEFSLGNVSELRRENDQLRIRLGEVEDERDSVLGTLRTLEPRFTAPVGQSTLPDPDGAPAIGNFAKVPANTD